MIRQHAPAVGAIAAFVLMTMELMTMAPSSFARDAAHPAAPAADARKVIVLADAERALILTEMRQFLGAVQVITAALAEEDFERAAEAAHGLGLAAAQEVPASVTAKLPMEFKRLGRSTHAGFDRVALDARELGDAQHSLEQLGALLGNCVACHATFQLRGADGER